MKIHQLSLFLENRPGAAAEPVRLLAAQGVNIRTLMLADTSEFGILRLIVSDWRKADALLTAAGFVVNVTEVLAVEVADRPGGLAEVIEAFENTPINIEYMYAFTFGRQDKAVLIFRFDKPDEAIARLREAGLNLVESVEVYGGLAG